MSETDTAVLFIVPRDTFTVAEPMARLRFIDRQVAGRSLRLLQQQWRVTSVDGARLEWHDIPLEQEEAE